MNSLPTLYKQTKTGATQVCKITYQDNYFYVTFGQHNGKMQTNPTQCYPKNVGKANETTGTQQAKFEAEAKWESKVKSGYSESIGQPSEVLLPQKVKVYQDNIKNVTFPCYSTPKLNGVNGTYWLLPNNSLKLTSRGGDEYLAIPHLEPEIRHLMELLNTTCLNGELYIHGEHLQDITSAVKKPKELSKSLEFVVFECPYIEVPYEEKYPLMETADYYLKNEFPNRKVQCIIPTKCTSIQDIEGDYNGCMDAGLEGTVIYLPEATYQFNIRSSYVFKYKKAKDGEFRIIGYELDKKDNPTLICQVEEFTFKVRPKGTTIERKQILDDFENLYLNQWYKVEYETLSKAGIPLKPVGIGLRNCDSEGNPLE